MPPGHPCRFPFPFCLFSSFFLSSFSPSFFWLSVFSFLAPFSLVLSLRLAAFRLFLVSPSSLLFSLPCFPWWRILLFCYFVSALHPPRAPCEPNVIRVFPLRAVFFLALLILTYFCFFFSSFPFSISIWPSFVSSRLFLVGTMLFPRFRFLLRLV